MPTKIYTAFQLFVRQCLLYPLDSPFLPSEADVKSGVSYAAGQKIGSYTGGPVWQVDQGIDLDWDSALIYAEYLEDDGVTIAATPQNIWHLPTLSELLIAETNSWVSDGSGLPGGFRDGHRYWSSLEVDSEIAWFAYGNSVGHVSSNYGNKNVQYAVRCAR